MSALPTHDPLESKVASSSSSLASSACLVRYLHPLLSVGAAPPSTRGPYTSRGRCFLNDSTTAIESGVLLLLEAPLLFLADDSLTSASVPNEIRRVYGADSAGVTGAEATHHGLRVMAAVVHAVRMDEEHRALFEQLHCPVATAVHSTTSKSTFYPMRVRAIIAHLAHLDLAQLAAEVAPTASVSITTELLIRYILIYDTNAVQVGEDGHTGGAAIYSTFSRINHDCHPNGFHSTDWRGQPTDRTIGGEASTILGPSSDSPLAGAGVPLRAVYSTRLIPPSSELTISYLPHCFSSSPSSTPSLLHATSIRRSTLMRERWFFCRCTRCDGPDCARAFRCAEADCEGSVMVQPKAMAQWAALPAADAAHSSAPALPIDVDLSAVHLHFACSDPLCLGLLTDQDQRQLLAQEQSLVAEFAALDDAVASSDSPELDLKEFTIRARQVVANQHWILQGVRAMLRDLSTQSAAEATAAGDPTEAFQRRREAVEEADAELEYVRRAMGGLRWREEAKSSDRWIESVPRIWTTVDQVDLPSQAVQVLPFVCFAESAALETLADTVHALDTCAGRADHRLANFLYSCAAQQMTRCVGHDHPLAQSLAEKIKHVQQASAADP